MSLTKGSGPLGPGRTGTFNFDTSILKEHTLYVDGCPKRVRTRLGSETIADSRRVVTLHETGHLPIYYFPREDVRMDLLEQTGHTTHCPFKGNATYWSIRVGDQLAENAVWSYETTLDDTPPIDGYLAFSTDQMDAWFEEDEQVIGHPRDPYTRIDVLQGSRHVRVSLNDEVIAESDRPKVLFETSLSPRFYLPPDDVRTDMLISTETETVCPYKGRASHWSVDINGTLVEDAAWGYPEPLPEATIVQNHFCFYGDKVTVEVDGQQRT